MRTFVQRLFLLACFSGGDAEVLEDFSPLSTNATYWKTRQNTFGGAVSRCPMRDECGGCSKGKYSPINVAVIFKNYWGGGDAFRKYKHKRRDKKKIICTQN